MKQTRQAVRAINQSIFLDVYGLVVFGSDEQIYKNLSFLFQKNMNQPGFNFRKLFFFVAEAAPK